MLRRTKKTKSHWLILSNPVARQSVSDQDFKRHIYGFLAREPIQTFTARTRILLQTNRFRKLQNFSATRVEDFGRFDVLGNQFVESRALPYFAEIINFSKSQIKIFLDFRDKIESAVIWGEMEYAKSLLDELESALGESIWSVRTRGLLMAETSTEQDVDSFFASVERRNDAPLVKFVLKSLRLIISAEYSTQRLNNIIGATINEFRETNEVDLIGFLHVLLCPEPLTGLEETKPALHLFQLLPVVDLYMVMLRLCLYETTKGRKTVYMHNYLIAVTKVIDDPVLARFSSAQSTHTENESSDRHILELYEYGNYKDVISEFYARKPSNPVGYANIVAKAMVHCGIKSEPTQGSLLEKLIASLAEIYSLTNRSAQSVERITAIAIRANHFLLCVDVQLTLYKAIPFRFEKSNLSYAAKASTLSSGSATPQTARLAQDPGFYARYAGSLDSNVPAHRRLKREIVALSTDANNVQFGLEKLYELKKSGGIKKDYLEIFSEYCLAQGCWVELIDEAAEHLIANGDTIISIPVAEIVDFIEQKEPTSLHALIIVAKYVKLIDDSKDFILHESVERYLKEKKANRPTELIERINSRLSPSELHFFKEVCALDVMDFLSCFQSSDELRAERVLILDRLLELGEIEPKFRMREIEDMVAQMIADAGNTEVSGPKIYVDTSAIIRKVSDEIAGLFLSYQSAKRSDSETVDYQILERISVDDEDIKAAESTIKFAFVIGDKNSVLLKMFGVAKAAFLFDEKNGLDKNLSTEIRHGFFKNLIRARLEERHLISEVDDKGDFVPNGHWQHATELLVEDIRNDIEESFRSFSLGINRAIVDAEGWMKIEGAEKDGEGMRFEIPLEIFEHTKKALDSISDAEEAAEIIVNALWSVTEYRIGEVRERVNTTFRASIDDLFYELETNIAAAKRGVPLYELSNAIAQTRSEIRDDITIAADWFRRTDASSFEDRSLSVAIKVAAKAFERIRGLDNAIHGDFDGNMSYIKISGPSVRPLTIALVNIFDNAFRHSGFGRATNVTVRGAKKGGKIHIDIENLVAAERKSALTSSFLEILNHKAKSNKSIELLRAEGGTGIVKAYQQILASHGNSDLTVMFDGDRFIASIIYGN